MRLLCQVLEDFCAKILLGYVILLWIHVATYLKIKKALSFDFHLIVEFFLVKFPYSSFLTSKTLNLQLERERSLRLASVNFSLVFGSVSDPSVGTGSFGLALRPWGNMSLLLFSVENSDFLENQSPDPGSLCLVIRHLYCWVQDLLPSLLFKKGWFFTQYRKLI